MENSLFSHPLEAENAAHTNQHTAEHHAKECSANYTDFNPSVRVNKLLAFHQFSNKTIFCWCIKGCTQTRQCEGQYRVDTAK